MIAFLYCPAAEATAPYTTMSMCILNAWAIPQHSIIILSQSTGATAVPRGQCQEDALRSKYAVVFNTVAGLYHDRPRDHDGCNHYSLMVVNLRLHTLVAVSKQLVRMLAEPHCQLPLC